MAEGRPHAFDVAGDIVDADPNEVVAHFLRLALSVGKLHHER